MEAEAEDRKDIVSDLFPQVDSDNSNKSRDHITTNSTVIPVLICQTGYASPTMVHSLANFARKKDRHNKKLFGVIGKREYENYVVRITLQVRQLKWKKVTIPKVKGDGAYLMSIFYADPNHKEKCF